MSRASTFKQWIGQLSIIDKTFIISLAIRLVYAFVGTAGVDLPGSGTIRFLFIVVSLIFLVRSFPKLLRKLLWRVRHRLLVTWVLVGVVPIVLIAMLVGEGLYMLLGQMAGYMVTSEINRRNDWMQSAAQALAWNVSHRQGSDTVPALAESFVKETSEARHAVIGAIVRSGRNVFAVPQAGDIREIPKWSKPGSVGMLRTKDGHYYIAAHESPAGSTDNAEVFLYQHAPVEFFKNLLPGIASIVPDQGEIRNRGINIRRGNEQKSGISVRRPRGANEDRDIQPIAPPPGRHWWDIAVNWFVLIPNKDLDNGDRDQGELALVASRPSLIVGKMFGQAGTFIFIALTVITACLLLVVEIVSVAFGAKLTRSITRAVNDLYAGTRKIQAGDFSHRIPVRKNKDQLSELAGSFNNMTERIQHLIVEVKEKERLENELEIARDVQSRLFPKEVPHLKTLELWGGCQPARTVSGDYYDFVLAGSNLALAIGDISGKGISAALLMAHIQSALRSHFTHPKNGTGVTGILSSPSSILSILNDHLYSSSPPEKYATFFLGMYGDESGELIYTNAGHLAPVLVRQGQIRRLPGEGFPVGLFPGIQYEQQSITLERGDLFVAFTDGVTETPNHAGEEFGTQRLADLLIRYSDQSLDGIAGEIIASVGSWASDVERHDDTTLLLARRL